MKTDDSTLGGHLGEAPHHQNRSTKAAKKRKFVTIRENLVSAALSCIALMALPACQTTSTATKAPASPESDATQQSTHVEYGEMPSDAARAQREVLLHASLYRAAYESNVGQFTKHFLLEPVVESDPPAIAIDPAEFKRRVLDALSDLNLPMAWVADTWRTAGVDYFPGTQERATRLRIKIFDRDENQATVQGEVGDTTEDVGSARQKVTATWDGRQWAIERDRVRLVW